MMPSTQMLVVAAGAVVLALLVDYMFRRTVWAGRQQRATAAGERLIDDARKEAANIKRTAKLAASEAADELEARRSAREQEERERSETAAAQLVERSRELDRKAACIQRDAASVDQRHTEVERREKETATRAVDVQARAEELQTRLEDIAAMTREEARDRLAEQVVDEARKAATDELRRVTAKAKVTIDERLREMMTRAVQRVPSTGVVESTVTVIRLPSDDMKGRIIGREGRNIRSIEMATGIDLIVDDTPQAILISCFDPVRREVARVALERLVEDGRIHPARIEELVEKAREDLDALMEETGDATVYELGIEDLDAKLLPLVGRLKYHTVTGQNLLQHCRETADLAGALAAELGISSEIPRRAGLLHEIAQADDDRPVAPSIIASAELAGRHGESMDVQHAIAAIHEDVAPRRLEAALTRFACRASRARPGARKHNLETFISRMRRLENMATSITGVRTAHAFRAGKEIRVIVESNTVSDEGTVQLCKDLASRIDKEVEHTGQIRVTALRETRTVDYAL